MAPSVDRRLRIMDKKNVTKTPTVNSVNRLFKKKTADYDNTRNSTLKIKVKVCCNNTHNALIIGLTLSLQKLIRFFYHGLRRHAPDWPQRQSKALYFGSISVVNSTINRWSSHLWIVHNKQKNCEIETSVIFQFKSEWTDKRRQNDRSGNKSLQKTRPLTVPSRQATFSSIANTPVISINHPVQTQNTQNFPIPPWWYHPHCTFLTSGFYIMTFRRRKSGSSNMRWSTGRR